LSATASAWQKGINVNSHFKSNSNTNGNGNGNGNGHFNSNTNGNFTTPSSQPPPSDLSEPMVDARQVRRTLLLAPSFAFFSWGARKEGSCRATPGKRVRRD
jgi:hypothetical protein